MDPDDLPVKVLRGSEIPVDVMKLINEVGLLDLGGIYGDESVGDPVEYDYLKIILLDSVVELEFFNRGITLFMTDDETLKHIHHIMCLLNRA